MPTFTAQTVSPKNSHVTFHIDARNAYDAADAHRAALFFRLIAQSTSGLTTLRRVILLANGKEI